MQTSNQPQNTQPKTLKQRYHTAINRAAVVIVPVAFAASAHAELDMSEGATQLALGLAAVGAIGAAKLAPSALTWVWNLVTQNAKRG